MTYLFRSPSAAADIPPVCIVSDSAGASCSSPEKHGVGQDRLSNSAAAVPHDRAAEDRLDKLIADLEAKARKAEGDGDPHGAAIYRDRRDAAAACRTPEHRSRLHSAADQYLHDLDAAEAIGGCFFDAMGQAQMEKD